jgi:hypothetical protein
VQFCPMLLHGNEGGNPLGREDLPMEEIARDWFGEPVADAPTFALLMDRENLWFLAGRGIPAISHPASAPGAFQAELWRYDVVEVFIAGPQGNRYYEFNVSPNGGWWSCEYVAPRVRATGEEIAFAGAKSHAITHPDGSWRVALSIPVAGLRELIGFGPGARANVAMILETPGQRFLTVHDLGGGAPDYHRPKAFPTLRLGEGVEWS